MILGLILLVLFAVLAFVNWGWVKGHGWWLYFTVPWDPERATPVWGTWDGTAPWEE